MTTTENRPTDYKVIGTRPIRHDGVDKVTGRAKYGADVIMPGLLHGKVAPQPPCPRTHCQRGYDSS